ncbi:MAG: nicotinamide riboside transporter PnuC [Alphaproteobacteria bacterium]|nr:nicotinamide riboside transporter PnuC [Alphaproteobacteria bacterium]
MNGLEGLASLATAACVVLAVHRSLWQFPLGAIGTALYFFVFLEANLYSSALLQVFFFMVQSYGWWYWLKGEKGSRPPIRRTSGRLLAAGCMIAIVAAVVLSALLDAFTEAEVALPDAVIFALSVVAQLLLDRKRLENWPLWIVVNLLSIIVYSSQGLWLTVGLYVFLFFNAFWGWREWLREYKRSERTADA